MSAELIISYDGTANDEDAVALGRLLGGGGAGVALAYVRHSRQSDPRREQAAEHDAQRLLEQGANSLNGQLVACHVLLNASTPDGLRDLAEAEGASAIVFGSEYRTPLGRAEPGTSAQKLLDGGALAIAVAAAGLRADSDAAIRRIAVANVDDDAAAARTAHALADRFDASVVDVGAGADLVVVGSRPDGRPGRIDLSGAARATLNAVRGSVLVVPSGVPLLV